MAAFSIGEAVGSGFRLIRDHPGAVLMWGLAYFVVAMTPILAATAMVMSDFVELSKLSEANAESDPVALETVLAMQAKMMLVQAVQLVSTVAGAAILYCAVFRAVLEPEDKRHWYLRLGQQEIWISFVFMVVMTLAFMAMFVGMIPISIAGLLVGTTGGGVASWAILVGAGVGVLCLIAWASIRLALAYPMTFAERKFRLFESWALTRGHAGRMALTYLIILGLVLLIELVFLVLFIMFGLMILAASGVTIPWNEGPDAQMASPPGGWTPFLVVAVPGAALAFSVISAAAHAISLAPLAYVYRQLRPAEAST